MTTDAYQELRTVLARLKQEDRFRQCQLVSNRHHKKAAFSGRTMINLSSNDYLGLAANTSLHETFFQPLNAKNRFDDFGLSASSSRLLTGHHPQVAELEHELAQAYQRESALVFNSGYHANTGIISTLFNSKDIIFCDRLNHASIIDGVRLSGAKLVRFHHLDYNHLESLLNKKRSHYRRAVIITESIFSMNGDCANLADLVAIKKQHDAWLYVDEAHGVGVFGRNGLGLAEASQMIHHIDIIVGTMGKAFASVGAFIICDQLVKDYLINTMRALIFTTALPPINVHWSRFILSLMPQLIHQRHALLDLALTCRQALAEQQLISLGQSQIIPIILGDNETAVSVAMKCREHGLLLFPIRPPTVPIGSARLRLSLTANLVWKDIECLPKLIKSCIDH